jgi:hypothetical protein
MIDKRGNTKALELSEHSSFISEESNRKPIKTKTQKGNVSPKKNTSITIGKDHNQSKKDISNILRNNPNFSVNSEDIDAEADVGLSRSETNVDKY